MRPTLGHASNRPCAADGTLADRSRLFATEDKNMQTGWISVETIARDRGISVAAALALAERMNWPRVFRTHETLFLAPPSSRT